MRSIRELKTFSRVIGCQKEQVGTGLTFAYDIAAFQGLQYSRPLPLVIGVFRLLVLLNIQVSSLVAVLPNARVLPIFLILYLRKCNFFYWNSKTPITTEYTKSSPLSRDTTRVNSLVFYKFTNKGVTQSLGLFDHKTTCVAIRSIESAEWRPRQSVISDIRRCSFR